MSESSLDQIVKGAPPPSVSVPSVAGGARRGPLTSELARALKAPSPPLTPTDPLSTLPSSPPQIYLNLLILEASLRAQYLTLRARRRQHSFVIVLLTLWTATFAYALFLRPREDGKGVGGSPYWVVDMAEKVALMGGVVTWILIWGTGQWERGVRWPRRWVGVANRGLRGMNCKIVVLKGPWWKELFSQLAFLFPYSSYFRYQGSSYHLIDPDPAVPDKQRSRNHAHERDVELAREEDVAPGGDYIKLLLLPKPFSRDFRENWELYRTEYWEKENGRRAGLRKQIRQRERELAKAQGGWLWWTGWRGWKRARGGGTGIAAATAGGGGRRPGSSGTSHQGSQRDVKEKKRRPSLLRDHDRDGSHSRSSSRSSTATPDADPHVPQQRQRRGSSSTTGSTGDSRRRKKLGPTAGGGLGGSSRVTRLTPAETRTRTPTSASSGDVQHDLGKRSSMLSVASSTGSERSVTPGESPPGSPKRSAKKEKGLDGNAEQLSQI